MSTHHFLNWRRAFDYAFNRARTTGGRVRVESSRKPVELYGELHRWKVTVTR